MCDSFLDNVTNRTCVEETSAQFGSHDAKLVRTFSFHMRRRMINAASVAVNNTGYPTCSRHRLRLEQYLRKTAARTYVDVKNLRVTGGITRGKVGLGPTVRSCVKERPRIQMK